MSLMEQKNKAKRQRVNLELRLSQRFEQLYIRDALCFRKADGVIFSLCYLMRDNAFVIEYANNLEEAKLNRFEDGDLFYLEEMDEETMFQNMIREIG